MENIEICPCCGHKTVTYSHGISKVVVACLSKLYKAGGKAEMKSLGLTNSQYTNLNRLSYFGLAVFKDGEWVITKRGNDFLYGLIKLPKKIFVKNGDVIGESDEKVLVSEVKECVQYKEEYIAQASGQLNLL